MNKSNFFKLAVMMFLQYMLFAVWWSQFAAYLENMQIAQIALIMSSMAIGSMAAPLVGMFADRYIASEKLLAALNLLVAGFLFLATRQTGFAGLMTTITLAMLCYMPTWSLTSSIAMTHISTEQFPKIRLFGTFGWIASALFSLTAGFAFSVDKFDGTVLPLYCGAVTALFTALFNLFLPKTPPTGSKSDKYSIVDILGLRVISTLKNSNFNRFVLISALAVIPFVLYQSYVSMFLSNQGFEYITVTMNIGQLAELFFLFITTAIIVKFGFKNALLFGLLAMFVRYLSFTLGIVADQQWLYYIAIVPHGLIFGLFFVAGQVYTDKLVSKEFRAQAQGFLAFALWGVACLIGTLVNGWLINILKTGDATNWTLLFLIAGALTLAAIALLLLFFKNPSKDDID